MSKIQGRFDRWVSRGFAGYLGISEGMRRAVPTRSELEEGSTTVEYAIGAIATAGFAGLLIAVLKSGGVKSLIMTIIQSALSI